MQNMKGSTINNYIYSYRDIIKSLIKYASMTTTKSKVINPLYIGTRLNSADFETTIYQYVDSIRILKLIKDYNKIFIFLAIVEGFSETQIAEVLQCSRQNVNKHKQLLKRQIRSKQLYDKQTTQRL